MCKKRGFLDNNMRLFYEQDPEEHGGRVGPGDHPVPQRVCRQPGDALLPLVAFPQLAAVRPCTAPHAAQHDEEGLSTVSPTVPTIHRKLPPLHVAPLFL